MRMLGAMSKSPPEYMTMEWLLNQLQSHKTLFQSGTIIDLLEEVIRLRHLEAEALDGEDLT